jgi:hypothetical protein
MTNLDGGDVGPGIVAGGSNDVDGCFGRKPLGHAFL